MYCSIRLIVSCRMYLLMYRTRRRVINMKPSQGSISLKSFRMKGITFQCGAAVAMGNNQPARVHTISEL